MVSLNVTLSYYKRLEIREAIIAAAKNKEIAVRFGDNGFGKRPDALFYPDDVLEAAKNRASSFHASEEIWSNPLQLRPGMPRQEMDELRKGWDLVLDIDCQCLDYSRLAADLLVEAIKYHGTKSVSVKFSGNHGFHIGVPFEAFPSTVPIKGLPMKTKDLFPEAPRRIAAYLKDLIHNRLANAILEFEDITTVSRRFGKPFHELVHDGKFDPFTVLGIDAVLISSRHLYRMPYSINEKSGLVSVPIEPGRAKDFIRDVARPENVDISPHIFLDCSSVEPNEAKRLIVDAFDHRPETNDEGNPEKKKYDEFDAFQEAAPQEHFPPCMKLILAGLKDGKKRSMFVLINFLASVGYTPDAIDGLLHEWNKQNPEPLREVLLEGQIRHHKSRSKSVKPILPPNCSNMMYYKDMGICQPDSICKRIKNPVHYVRRRAWLDSQAAKPRKKAKQKNAAHQAAKDAKGQESLSGKTDVSQDAKPPAKSPQPL